MKRTTITIDETKCNGCGLCMPNCPEGALRMIDGKARLVNDSLCDGLGACLGHCPEGAIRLEEKDAAEYDERAVLENVFAQGMGAVRDHLKHLKEHGEHGHLKVALTALAEKGIAIPETALEGAACAGSNGSSSHGHGGCPGSRSVSFSRPAAPVTTADSSAPRRGSRLSHWPLQLHLISPLAPHYRRRDLLLAADCVAFSLAGFHEDYLDGKALAIACPKLDDGQDVYVEKLTALVDEAEVNTITVMTMEVPCCSGLVRLIQSALAAARRKVPVKHVQVALDGRILKEDWI